MKSVIFCFGLVAIFLNCAAAQTVVLQPGSEGIDTYICDCLPNANNPNGPVTVLYQGQYGQCFDRILLRWDISALPPNAVITRAVMELKVSRIYGSLSDSGRMVYYRIVGNWGETSVTCSTIPNFATEDSIVTGWPRAGQWHAVDITEFVQKWYADTATNRGIYGFCYGTKAQCDVEFIASDASGSADRPKLTITYVPATSIDGSLKSTPVRFHLEPNYPNPFNPSTTVSYSIPQRTNVRMTITDMQGREMSRPVDGVVGPGRYSVTVDGSKWASGIYLCTLRAGNVREVRKMVLLK